jgi:flagellar protein FlaJ
LLLILIFFLASAVIAVYPIMRNRSNAAAIDKELPYALRHMSSLLTAGISIFDSINSVAKADYGPLSEELEKVSWTVRSGENLSDALGDSAARINSKSFNRVVIHIKRALQMGGDVAEIISKIADDLTFELRMKISDFVGKLNALAIVYLVGGIVGPVMVSVLSIVFNVPLLGGGSGGMSPLMVAFIMLLVFPMLMVLLVYMTKIMEPTV